MVQGLVGSRKMVVWGSSDENVKENLWCHLKQVISF